MGSSCVRAVVPTRAPCHFFAGSPSLFPLPALFRKEKLSQTAESHFIFQNISLSLWLFHDFVKRRVTDKHGRTKNNTKSKCCCCLSTLNSSRSHTLEAAGLGHILYNFYNWILLMLGAFKSDYQCSLCSRMKRLQTRDCGCLDLR